MRAYGRAVLGFTVTVTVGALALPVTLASAAPVEITAPTAISRDGQTMYFTSMSAPVESVTGHGAHRSDFDGDGIDDITTTYFPNHSFTAPAWVGDGGIIVQYSHAGRTDYFNGNRDNSSGNFGVTYTTGDFNHDGYDDLVIGDPDEGIGNFDAPGRIPQVGGLWVIYGSPTGLDPNSAQHFNENTPGVPGSAEQFDSFAGSLAAGDLNGDGYADLAIGSAGESIGSVQQAGDVTVLYGSASGLTTTKATSFSENTAGVPGTAEFNDTFGFALAIGNVTGDKYADLAVGAAGEQTSVGNYTERGEIMLFRGAKTGLSLSGITDVTGTKSDFLSGTPDQVSVGGIGDVLAIGDVNGDGLGDVVAGVPGADVASTYEGAVVVFPGRSSGLSESGRQYITAESAGVAGTTVFPNGFGATISVGDVTGDGRADVLIGDALEPVGSAAGAGVVWMIPGSSHGLTGTGSQEISQATSGVPGTPEANDAFGAAVAILNLDGKGGLDAVVGSPGEMISGDIVGYPAGTDTSFLSSAGKLVAQTSWTGKSLVTPDFDVYQFGLDLAGEEQ